MKILWVSCLAWNDEGKYRLPVNGAGAVSGSLFQQSMIEGLEELGHEVDIVGDYPHAPGKIVNKSFDWSHRVGSQDVAIKSVNAPYVSLLFKEFYLLRALKKQIKHKSYDVVIAYLIHQPYMKAIACAKRKIKNMNSVIICPDLPNMMDMSLNEKFLKRMLKKVDAYRIERLYKYIDGFVLFAKKMREQIPIHNRPYTVIEGVATVEKLDTSPVAKEKFIMHAGTLHKNIGIENIIDSMKYIEDKNVKLKIFGTGELSPFIEECAEKDPRIEFFGFVSREELFDYQKKAIALVNARNPEDDFTKYSFPSKTFEYLYSGTPFVSTWLEGYPDEYKKHLFVIPDNKPETIAHAINEIMGSQDDELACMSQKAREFIIKEKNARAQGMKLHRFLLTLKGESDASKVNQ